jgi:hypothetical protein
MGVTSVDCECGLLMCGGLRRRGVPPDDVWLADLPYFGGRGRPSCLGLGRLLWREWSDYDDGWPGLRHRAVPGSLTEQRACTGVAL